MSNPDPFTAYLRELRNNLATGAGTEHTHRLALKALLEALKETMQLMQEIDELIPAWPIE